MYNNSTHYPTTGYPNAYQQYPTSYGNENYNYQAYAQYANQQTAQPVPPTDGSYQSNTNWSSSGYGSTQKDAVAQEMQQQKTQLINQREDYVKKVYVLRHELDQLRIQKQELMGDGRSSNRDLGNIMKENDKLQEEIQGKMKAIQNVIEMLSSIIKDGQSIADLEAALVEKEAMKASSPQKHPEGSHLQKSNTPDSSERYCYIHYDTGLHWCRVCDEFPDTAKDLLLHLQDRGHREMAKENDVDSTPWHKLPAEAVLPSYEDAPTKRIPIKGLQFFISAPSWYCKLCDTWVGDLHCASHHLKSQGHFQNYENFVAQNPKWEMEWLKDREKAMTRKGIQNSSDDSDEQHKQKKKHKDKRHSYEHFSLKDKKKKKRSKKRRKHSTDSSSSSSSSDSSSEDDKTDRSKSIRVAMRNMKQVQSIMEEDLTSKWNVLEKLVEEHKRKQEELDKLEKDKAEKEREKKETPEDPLINQWMTVSHTQEKDKLLLDTLRDRMRHKQGQERVKQEEIERKKREKEKEELEMIKRRELELKRAAEEAERESKRREQEELNRIRDKDRNQVRFKTSYRRKRSGSKSDEEESQQEKYYRHEMEKSRERHRRDSDRSSSHRSRETRSRSISSERKIEDNDSNRKKPPGPPSYKKLPFIGRMPLFKNKKTSEEKEEKKEIQKESYDQPRRTRFEPGNLPRAFMPKPDVVCFPKLSSIPPLTIPPPPSVSQRMEAPEPPTISEQKHIKKNKVLVQPQPPPPPKIEQNEVKAMNLSDDEVLYANSGEGMDPSMMGQYYQDYATMMYSHEMYPFSQDEVAPPAPSIPHSHTMPLEPPPLPPDDDLALLGICADDMAAQTF